MTARPIPQRLAGYEPAPPVEIGRVPTARPAETPLAVTPLPGFPPEAPGFAFPPFSPLPPIHVPPVIIPPGEEPCDPAKDPECPPEEPPVDAPEPGVLILLLTGVLVYSFFRRRTAV